MTSAAITGVLVGEMTEHMTYQKNVAGFLISGVQFNLQDLRKKPRAQN
jgi:hypothetical protein